MLQKLVEEALVGLRGKLVKLNVAIRAMEDLASDIPRRGRPPKSSYSDLVPGKLPKRMTSLEKLKEDIVPASSLRKAFSKATRKKMAAAQKRRWAAHKKFKKAEANIKKVLTMKTGKKVA